jgi:hypothetical protein
VADGEQGSRRGYARLSAVCAVLFGLFLMHGAPATASAGCHSAMSAPVSMRTGPGHPGAAMTSAALTATVRPGTSAHMAQGAESHGTTCVSVSGRDRIPLPAAGLVAVVVIAALSAWLLAGRPVGRGRARRRGPPDAGRSLLLQVCIART